MRIELFDGSRDEWDKFVAKSGDSTYGHLWAWREIIGAAYGFDSYYVMARGDDGRALAAAPFIFVKSRLYGKELTSMPYIDYGGICHADSLSDSERAKCDAAMFGFAQNLASKLGAKRLHVRSTRSCEPPFVVSTEKVTQHLPLARTVEEQLRKLPSERRNRLRHCQRHGLVTEIRPWNDSVALREFYRIYAINMRDLGSPTHSLKFFRSVCSELKENVHLITVRHQGTAIASAIAFEFRGSKSLPWSGATLGAQAVYGTNELYWAAIKRGIEAGCHTFDFGRSSLGSGIFEFKRRWGPHPFQPYWSTLYLKAGAKAPKTRPELQFASRLWKYMPIAVQLTVGPQLRKGISN